MKVFLFQQGVYKALLEKDKEIWEDEWQNLGKKDEKHLVQFILT